jgi:hypothetical protein
LAKAFILAFFSVGKTSSRSSRGGHEEFFISLAQIRSVSCGVDGQQGSGKVGAQDAPRGRGA